jgi:hypothetical protein
MEVVSKEVAENDVSAWLDYIRIRKTQRESEFAKVYINHIIESVMEGLLIINEDKTITQKLLSPIGEGGITKEIVYNSRFEVGKMIDAMSLVKSNDEASKTIAVLSLLSNKPVGMFKKLERSDYVIAEKITLFF